MFGLFKKKRVPYFHSLIGGPVQIFSDRIEFDEGIHIDGKVNIDLNSVHGNGYVRVGANGEVNGKITCPNVAVAGIVNGDVIATEEVELTKGGKVTGRVICKAFVGDSVQVLGGVSLI